MGGKKRGKYRKHKKHISKEITKIKIKYILINSITRIEFEIIKFHYKKNT